MEFQSSNSGHNVALGDDKKILVDDGIVQTTSTGEEHLSASTALDPAAERRLVWKFDLRILPTLAIMYLFNALVSYFPHLLRIQGFPVAKQSVRTKETWETRRLLALKKTSTSRTDSTISFYPFSLSRMS